MEQILEKRIQIFQDYINSLIIPEKWRHDLINPETLGKQTQVYLFYPELFWQSLNSNKYQKELDQICIAAYLYFASIIIQDKLIDNKKQANLSHLPLISFLQEESIKILTTIFPVTHPFWLVWQKHRITYIESINHDFKHTNKLDIKFYENFAISKSVYALAAIDSAFYIRSNNCTQTYSALLDSQKNFSIGFQLLDDMEDIAEDFNNGQINYIINYCTWEGNNLNISFKTAEELKKYFYLSNNWAQVLDKSEFYLKKSLDCIKSIENLNVWKGVISSQLHKVSINRNRIDIYTKEVYARSILSNNKLNSRKSLDYRINLLLSFIKKQQVHDGSFCDMLTNQGISRVWTTAFLVWNISPFIKSEGFIKKSLDFLAANKSDSFWGYNSNWGWDVDSSLNVLLAYHANNISIEKEFKALIKYKSESDLFSTYPTDKYLVDNLGKIFNNFDGWKSEHLCVSSLALYLMYNFDVAKPYNKAVLKSIIDQQSKNKLWESYWWTSPIYSTCIILRTLIESDEEKYEQLIIESIDSLIKKRNKDYSFSNSLSQASHFFTFMVLDLLCSSISIFQKYRNEVNGMISWFFKTQNSDGSFPSSVILRIPSPENKSPETIEEWHENNISGVNIVRKDFLRIFTSAIAFSALNKYKQMKRYKSKT